VARLLLGVMRREHATLGLLAESTGGQARAFRRASGGTFGAVPGRRRGETNAVVYDTRSYRLERVTRLRSFSYRGRRMPLVIAVLRDRETGARIGAMAVHHPSSHTDRGTQDRWQRSAWRRELRALRRLRAAYDGRISTFLGGDFNDSSTCRMVARTGMVSPLATVSSCPTARTRIDQVFADRTVTFSGYHPIIRGIARMTDHPGVYAATFALRQPA
jgi:endonuclease/exonuclease/phosphatase (EEP) superfamily protein YafD